MTFRLFKITAAAALVMLTLPSVAAAEDASPTMHMKELCSICAPQSAELRAQDPSGAGNTLVSSICHSFITGVLSYNGALVGTGHPNLDICAPPEFTVKDAKRVFLKYCEAHPEAAPYEASTSLMAALQAAYPCKTSAHTENEPPHQMTVGDLQELCTSHDEGNKAACSFYILGVAQGSQVAAAILGDKSHFCTPDEVTGNAMELAVKMRIGEVLMVFPDDKKELAVSFIIAAMQKTFPCHSSH